VEFPSGAKAGSGVRVRILLGDPDSQVVTDRGEDGGVGDAMAAKIRDALALYRPLRSAGGVEVRFHRTILYNSIYRADDQVLVNTHGRFRAGRLTWVSRWCRRRCGRPGRRPGSSVRSPGWWASIPILGM
jgi:hypothetical protein